MVAFVTAHWADIMFHLGLDLTGGITLRCAMGMCKHKVHQYMVWGVVAIIVSIATVYFVG